MGRKIMLKSRETLGGCYPGVARTGCDYKNEEKQLLEGMACPEGIELLCRVKDKKSYDVSE